VQTLEQRFKRPPSESELADEIGVPLVEYQQILQDARGHQLVYFEDFKPGDDDDFFEHHVADQDADPLGLLEDSDFRRALITAIGELPEREQLVMSLYYDEELNLREIGEVLGVTESRVCQLHSQAVARLRASVVGEAVPAPRKRRGRPPRAKG
jgi:RNA polymerase sigma factor for flagellar operon FliA